MDDKDKVDLNCIICGDDYQLSYGRYRRIKDGNYRCRKCMLKYRGKVISNKYQTLSEEEKQNRSNKIKSRWTKEKRKQMSDMKKKVVE